MAPGSRIGRSRTSLSTANYVDLTALIEELGLERFSLYASSAGGPIAISYAALHPERVENLVLYGTFARLEGVTGHRQTSEALVSLMRAEWGLASTGLDGRFYAWSLKRGTGRVSHSRKSCQPTPRSQLASGRRLSWQMFEHFSPASRLGHSSYIPGETERSLSNADGSSQPLSGMLNSSHLRAIAISCRRNWNGSSGRLP